MQARTLRLGAGVLLGANGLFLLVGSLSTGPDVFLSVVGALVVAAAGLMAMSSKRWAGLSAIVVALVALFPLIMVRVRGPSDEFPTEFASVLAGPVGWVALVTLAGGIVAGFVSFLASVRPDAEQATFGRPLHEEDGRR